MGLNSPIAGAGSIVRASRDETPLIRDEPVCAVTAAAARLFPTDADGIGLKGTHHE
ncbi:hypothetical protein [Hyphococcus sp.]|jgi:hypothetical protein|uniref:hypothetical protein n=1 Tax=Hyphococcus sp. TaxID=2038636 RepID=UPI003D135837